MAVATAMTAERTPIFLVRACFTIAVALEIWAGDIGIQSCGPLVPIGVSLSAAGTGPSRAAAGFVCRLIAFRTWIQVTTVGWRGARAAAVTTAAWCAAGIVGASGRSCRPEVSAAMDGSAGTEALPGARGSSGLLSGARLVFAWLAARGAVEALAVPAAIDDPTPATAS